MKDKIIKLAKQNAVLIIAFILAAVSTAWVPVSSEYFSYIDWRVLTLLFCLMAVVAGLQESGVFKVLAQKLLSGRKNMRLLCILLVLLPFFFSMIITNDVALITFVPFTILVFSVLGNNSKLIYVIVLQTVAANLGSMMTPVGNPQNLYLYSHYGISSSDFILSVLPFAAVSLVGILIASCITSGEAIKIDFKSDEKIKEPRKLIAFLGLLLICLLTVFHVINYILLLCIIVIYLLIFSRKTFAKVDYGLLLTFICFFVFSENMASVTWVQEELTAFMGINGIVASAAVSQVISNVPAAVLLSGFTDNWKALLIGTNIGGLGTLIASLASLISFQIYIKTDGARPLKYLGIFTIINVIGLIILLGLSFIIQ